MEYNEELELRQVMSTFKAGIAQLEDYLIKKNLEYQDRFSVIENELHKNIKTKEKILAILQEDLNGI